MQYLTNLYEGFINVIFENKVQKKSIQVCFTYLVS